MNLFQLVFKNMRQRALSTWLTMLSILLGVALAVAILVLRREGQNLFAQSDFGYDVLIGPPKGSPLQLTLNTVYHMDQSPGVIPYALYEDLSRQRGDVIPPGRPDYRASVKLAIPFMVGDSYNGRRIVGTSPQMFGVDDEGKPVAGEPFQYRTDKRYELAQGRVFAPKKFEAVIGSEVAEREKMVLYDDKLPEDENEKRGGAFRATHGMPGPNETPDIHKPRWRVVGILKPTHTANDRVLFVPLISLYAIAEHEDGMLTQAMMRAGIDPSRIPPDKLDETLAKLGFDPKRVPESAKKSLKLAPAKPKAAPVAPGGDLLRDATPPPKKDDHDHDHDQDKEKDADHDHEDHDAFHLDDQGNIVPDLPKEQWALSAILVKSRGQGFQAQQLMYNFKVIDDRATAVNPASVMREFFNTFLAGSTQILLIISALVTVVAAASIMTSIYNSVTARRREIAILRALGATRNRILTLICLEAALIGLIGGLVGLAVGHLLSAARSVYHQRTMGEGIRWLQFSKEELAYLVAVVVIAFLAGLVPALKAYSTPVVDNLAAT
jgi:putative ABC transport system permease protein